MTHEYLPNELLGQVTPQHVRSYALAKGWRRVPNVNGRIALFDGPTGDLEQLIVPTETTLDDYDRRIRDVVQILSEWESRSAVEVLNDLLMPDSDVIRYRVSSASTEKGTVPLLDGIRLLEGARMSLLAAACSVVNPVTHHRRMALAEAQRLVEATQLSQTERGSFTVAVACPLQAVEQDRPVLSGIDPFARQATILLMRSVNRLISAIEADEITRIYQTPVGEPRLTANLCDALLQMQPGEERSALSLSMSWASTLAGPSESEVPRTVRIKHEHFAIIEDVYRKLRPANAPQHSLFVGFVETLNGQLGDDGRMQGETIFSIATEEGEMVTVRGDLNADDHEKAVDAYRDHRLVKFHAALHRGRRIHRFTAIRDFQVVMQ